MKADDQDIEISLKVGQGLYLVLQMAGRADAVQNSLKFNVLF